MSTESRDDVGKILGRHRQVEQPVATRAEFFIQIRKVVLEPFETIVVIKIRLEVLHAIKEGTKPRIGFRDAPSLHDSVFHIGNECLGETPARHSHDCEFFRKQTYSSQMKKRRKAASASSGLRTLRKPRRYRTRDRVCPVRYARPAATESRLPYRP